MGIFGDTSGKYNHIVSNSSGVSSSDITLESVLDAMKELKERFPNDIKRIDAIFCTPKISQEMKEQIPEVHLQHKYQGWVYKSDLESIPIYVVEFYSHALVKCDIMGYERKNCIWVDDENTNGVELQPVNKQE